MRNYNTSKIQNNNRNYNLLFESKNKSALTLSEVKKQRDAFTNPVARLGTGTDNILNAGTYERSDITQDYRLLNNLYRDNWIIQNIVEIIPNDITKKWFNILSSDITTAELGKFDKLYRRTKLISSINEGLKFGRLYGGALGIIMIKGQTDDLSEPLNYDLITPESFLGLFVLDRWCGAYPSSDIVKNPEDNDFGLPEYYDITDATLNISTRVHHSKTIRFTGRELSRDEKIKELYWGASEIESLYRELIRRDTTAENIASLVFKANLSVMKIKDLDQIFAINSVQAQNMFWNTLESISTIESSMGIKLVDAESDASFLNYTFSGIKDIYEGLMLDLAGATHIPVTKLFGRSPAGMNSTGESDLQNYYDYIDTIRESKFRPIIMKLLPILCLSVLGRIPDDIDFEFEEMKSLSDTEKAQLNQQYTSSIIEAFNSNLITQDIAQKELKNISEITGIFTNITDELIKSGEGKFINDLQQMQDPMAGMMGGDMGGMPGMEGGMNENTIGIGNEQDAIGTGGAVNKEEMDEIDILLNEIKQDIINKEPKENYNIDNLPIADSKETNTTRIAEYKRLEKLQKEANKEYDEITNKIYSYSNKMDIPLNIVNIYNTIKNKYDNLTAALNKCKEEIAANGGNIELLKATGDYDKEINDITERLKKIKTAGNLLSQRSIGQRIEDKKVNNGSLQNIAMVDSYNRIQLLTIIEELIAINKKIKEWKKIQDKTNIYNTADENNENNKTGETEQILNYYNPEIGRAHV